jgi:hypothetical protein
MKIELIKYYNIKTKKTEYALIREDNPTKFIDKKVIKTFKNNFEDFIAYILEKDGNRLFVRDKLNLFLNSTDIDDTTKSRLKETFLDKKYKF